MRRTFRTSCPTMTAISNIANHPILCQLNLGAAENRQEMPLQTKKDSNGASNGCHCNVLLINNWTAHIAVITQNMYRATKMKCGTLNAKRKTQTRSASSSPRATPICSDLLRLGTGCIVADSRVKVAGLSNGCLQMESLSNESAKSEYQSYSGNDLSKTFPIHRKVFYYYRVVPWPCRLVFQSQ